MEKKILIGFLLTLVIVVFIPVYALGEPARHAQALRLQQDEAIARGAETFASLCSSCHGPQGQGLIGPALKGTKLNTESLIKVITRGRQNDRVPMPAWGAGDGGPLRPNQVSDVASFIQNWNDNLLAEAEVKHQATVHMPEDPAAQGKQVFDSVGCSFCHGGAAEGTNFAPPLAGRTREQISKQVRQPRTPLMPIFTTQHLNDANLSKVADFLLSLKAPAPPATPTPSAQDANAAAATEGGKLFSSMGCSGCHGPDARGTAFAPDITGKTHDETAKQVRTPKGAMPPFAESTLSNADLEKIIAFLASQNMTASSVPVPTPVASPTPTPTPTSTPAVTQTPLPTPTPAPGQATPDPQAIAQGKQFYSSVGCSACHGADAKGSAFAPDITSKTPDEITKQVRTPKGAMPPFTTGILSDAGLQNIIAFLSGLRAASAPTPTPTPTLAPQPTAPVADPQAISQGKQLYSSVGCSACHGADAKGSAFAPNITSKTPDEITRQVRTPKGAMPPFAAGALSDADLAKVVAYLQSLK